MSDTKSETKTNIELPGYTVIEVEERPGAAEDFLIMWRKQGDTRNKFASLPKDLLDALTTIMASRHLETTYRDEQIEDLQTRMRDVEEKMDRLTRQNALLYETIKGIKL